MSIRVFKMKYTHLCLVLLCASVLRVGYILTLDNNLCWEDEIDYFNLAEKMKNGEGYVLDNGRPTAFRPVGYPLLLCTLKLNGLNSVTHVRYFQIVLSLINIILVYILTFTFISRSSAIWAALFASIYPYFIFTTGTLLTTTWLSFLLLGFTLLYLLAEKKNNPWLVAASAVMLGFAILSKTSAVVFVFVSLFWSFYKNPINRDRILKSVLFFCVVILCIVPWMVRNNNKLGTFQLSTNGGRNLWLGNNPSSTPSSGSNIAMPKLEEKIDHLDESSADQFYVQQALLNIKSEPIHYLLLTIKKALFFWRFDPSPTTEGYVDQSYLVKLVSILSYGPILLLSILGYITAPLAIKKTIRLWIYFALSFTLLHAIFISKVRLRLPLDYFLIMSAGYGACYVQQMLKNTRWFAFQKRYKTGCEHG